MTKRKLLAAAAAAAAVAAIATGCAKQDGGETGKADAATEAEILVAEAETEEPKVPIDEPEYDPDDYVEVGDLSALVIEVPERDEVTPEDVEERVASEIEFAQAYRDSGKDEVDYGDVALIDFVGRIDGEEFDGGSAEGFYLEIGSGTFVDGFEEQLVGAKVGETVDVVVTFPEGYSDGLSGKEATFETKVRQIAEPAKLDDALAKVLTGDENATAKSYEEEIRAELEDEAEQEDGYEKLDALKEALEGLTTVKGYPEEVLSARVDAAMAQYEAYADYFGVSLDEALGDGFGMTAEDAKAQAEEEAKSSLAYEMALLSVAKREGLAPTGEEMEKMLEKEAEENFYESVDELLEDYSRRYAEKAAVKEAVEERLLEDARIVRTEREPEVTFELDGPQEAEPATEEADADVEFETSAEAN